MILKTPLYRMKHGKQTVFKYPILSKLETLRGYIDTKLELNTCRLGYVKVYINGKK